MVTGASANAASTKKRLVRDLDPGTETVASSGPSAWGESQISPGAVPGEAVT